MKFIACMNLILSLLAGPCNAAPDELAVNTERSVVIAGVISPQSLGPIVPKLMELAKAETAAPIDLIIASPGGSVTAGFLFINLMEMIKARGTTLRCFVPTVAASMAFQILLHCDERYTLSKAFLLWHRSRVFLGGGLFAQPTIVTAPVARDLAEDLQRTDDIILSETVEILGISRDVVQHHFERETLHVGSQLAELAPGFIESQDYIPGLVETLASTLQKPETDVAEIHPGEIVYLSPGLLNAWH